jgi:TatD DNase family protein
MFWVDTHAHLDAPELQALPGGVPWAREAARAQGVGLCVLPAVHPRHFADVRQWAHDLGDAYALGIHPLWVPQATEADLATLDAALTAHASDPRLVAVGEIGLDFFVPALCTPALRERQQHFYRAQLKLAKQHRLPVLLHVRRSADGVAKHLRSVWAGAPPPGQAGIAHAFNGSNEQALALLALGLKLGFGGATTFDGARQLRHLAATLPDTALVLETDAPDIPPQWLYATAAQRHAGVPQGLNTPAELARIGAVVAGLRGTSASGLAALTTRNALQALPRLGALLPRGMV